MVNWTTFLKTTIVSTLAFSLSACGVLNFSKFSLPTENPDVTPPVSHSAFGANGVAYWNYLREGDSQDSPLDLLLMDDGRVWLSGHTDANNGPGFIKSYNSDGSLDNTFGYQKGNATAIRSPMFLGVNYATRLLQFGDYVYVVGQNQPGNEDLFVARLHDDGTYDFTYNIIGIATFDVTGGSDLVSDAKIQPDGKLVIAGQGGAGTWVVRVNTNGTLDSTFATLGKFEDNFSGSSYDEIQKVLLQDDGKIVLLGSYTDGTKKIALLRLNADGTLDGTFGTGGKASASASTPNKIYDGKILSDGKIIVAGNNNTLDIIIAKFTSTGALDTTFNTTGYVVRDLIGDDEAISTIDVQGDGKIVIGGRAGAMMSGQAFIARFNADGSTDTTFNSTGYRAFDFLSGELSSVAKITVLPNGGFMILGFTFNMGTGVGSSVISKLLSTGMPDTSFHTTGDKIVNVGVQTNDNMYKFKKLSTEKLIAVGVSANSNWDEFALMARFNTDGSIDTSFGSSGSVLYDAGFGASQSFVDVVEQADGKLVTLLQYYDSARKLRVYRYTAAGVLDTTFNSTGYTDITFSEVNADGYSLSLDENGKIYVAASTMGAGDSALAVARLTSSGAFDTSFNTTGKYENDLTADYDAAFTVKPLDDGKVLIVGGNDVDLILMRLDSTGVLDPTFGTAGVYTGNPLGGSDYYGVNDVAVVDGKYLLFAGYSSMSTSQVFLLKFNSNGSVDSSYGTGGIVTFPSYTNERYGGMYSEAGGKFMIGFSYKDTDDISHLDLRRVNADGSFDSTFNSGLPVSYVVPLKNDAFFVPKIEKYDDGGYIMGGSIDAALSTDFIFLRFTENGVQ